ncbi:MULTISPECIES: hypothetical protein [unclassified Dehalobacter]|uniref:hypothetical protein n=1 Tax=unclassified Dehalobacter TaxID=2635733 RepID=UPI0010540BDE|nr:MULTISPECIES: hypothetical protein [unclassified Dehalobacter]TCX51930.1 hypothetical protein C1I36_06325 [Dehalobacter sp. 14DCB1]TCX52990.1 hypothetical protein C1I38_08005 [Dehalobacter sp. 12DCB1]
MLADELASIAKKMYDITSIQDIYFDEVTEDFKVPSLYFPPVEQEPLGDTLSTFAYDNAVYIKVYGATTKAAMAIAEQIIHVISCGRNLIPVVDEEGDPTGQKFRLRGISYKAIEVGAAQLYVRWESVWSYTPGEEHTRAARMVFNILTKS